MPFLQYFDDLLYEALLRKERKVNAIISFITFFASATNAKFGIIPDAFFIALMFFLLVYNIIRGMLVDVLNISDTISIFGRQVSSNTISLILASIFAIPVYASYVTKLIPSIQDPMSQMIATFILLGISLAYQIIYYISLSMFIDEIEEIGDYRLLLFSLIILYFITLVSVKAFYEAFLFITKLVIST